LVAVRSLEAVAAQHAKRYKIESLKRAEASALTMQATTASEQSKCETTQLFVGCAVTVTESTILGKLTMFAQQIQPHHSQQHTGLATSSGARLSYCPLLAVRVINVQEKEKLSQNYF
jgi:hypothetical protein